VGPPKPHEEGIHVTKEQYMDFKEISAEFKSYVDSIHMAYPWLQQAQERLRIDLGYSDYKVETSAVYNRDLDNVLPGDNPPFIIVADNPGKAEQKSENQRYLVGQSGKLARGWFEKELGMDFCTSTLIINKTPIHTPKTSELRKLLSSAGNHSDELAALFQDSQKKMALYAFRLHVLFGNVLWISGLGELGKKGVFSTWATEIAKLYTHSPKELWEKVWVFRHFSMNQFAVEYSRHESGSSAPLDRLGEIGRANRSRIFG
jgi:hypothetical protein